MYTARVSKKTGKEGLQTLKNLPGDRQSNRVQSPQDQPMSQRRLADHLGLSPATVSLVLNNSPVADAIPQETKDRVFAAARELNYRPNFVARSLRTQRSFMIGVIVPEVSEGYAATVMGGIEDQLLVKATFIWSPATVTRWT